MRTGSNFLVSVLNQFPRVVCHGEAFNPAFVGLREDYFETFGLARDQTKQRDADIDSFYTRVIESGNRGTLCGFKLFPGHNPSILQRTLDDPTLAKIILKRDLLTSFISLCQAEQTGVWMIKDSDHKRLRAQRAKSDQKIHFDGPRFLQYRKQIHEFYKFIELSLKSSGQAALTLFYRDLQSSATWPRLATCLNTRAPSALEHQNLLVKQNTSPPHLRVSNLEEMVNFLDTNKIRGKVADAAKQELKNQTSVAFTTHRAHVRNNTLITSYEGFVIYGSMRTGSNFLVSLLNQLPGITCHGEAFNPAFVEVHEDYRRKLGITRSDVTLRDADIFGFYNGILQPPPGGLICGFKLFAQHSPPIMQSTLENTTISKILLKRDPLAAFISLCQAEKSNVWMIGDLDDERLKASRKKSDAPVIFNGQRFLKFAKRMLDFHQRVETAAHSSKSRLLVLDYTDLNKQSTPARLASFLGTTVGSVAEEKLLKKQNLSSIREKVINLKEMLAFLEANRLTESPVYADAKAGV